MDNITIDMVNSILKELPSKEYNPIVLVDQTGSVFNKIVKQFFDGSNATELNEILDINDLSNRQWLLETKPILIIYNIEKFGSGLDWQRRFFDLMNFTHENDINVIMEKILSEFPISHINFQLPSWTCMLSKDSDIYQNIMAAARDTPYRCAIAPVRLSTFSMRLISAST